jgi:hypothetical protein
MKTVTKYFLLAAVVGGFAAASACSLGLDPGKIGGDSSVPEGGDAAFIDASNPQLCKSDPDCAPINGNKCLTGKCGDAGHCNYDLCATTASCTAAVCDTNTNTCSAPSAYPFHSASFHVSLGNIGCGYPNPKIAIQRCFAAVYPFVFVGTTNGVVAYPVANPTETAPASIPVAGLPFFPNFIVANGQTVYFVGAAVGTGPDYKIPIAALDVLGDPTIGGLTATTVFNTLQGIPSVDAVFPDTQGGIYLVRADPTKSFPAARLSVPLKDLDTLSFSPSPGIIAGAGIAAASGSRLVTFRQENGATYAAFFSLESFAATGQAQNNNEQNVLSTQGQSYAPSYIAQSPTGGLLWTSASVNVPDGGPATTVAARLSWVLADQVATNFDATTHVEVQTYNQAGLGADLPGPAAWVDDNTAIVISAVPGAPGSSVVNIATRNGTPSVVPMRSFQLSFQPSQLAVASSNKYGYVLTPDQNTGANVHIFGTSCNSP